jgi:hypothetical protein
MASQPPRVAMPSSVVNEQLSLFVFDSDVDLIKSQLEREDSMALAMLSDSVCTIAIRGSAFLTLSLEEVPSLTQEEALRLVAIEQQPSMAQALTEWSLPDVGFDFIDENELLLASMEMELNGECFELVNGQQTESMKISPELTALFQKALSTVQPNLELSLQSIAPLVKFEATRIGQNAQMPAWLSDISARWFSHALRIHVLISASMPLTMNMPLTIDRCILSTGIFNQLPCRKINFVFHPSCGRCLCSAHKPFGAPEGAPKCILLQLTVSAESDDQYPIGAVLDARLVCLHSFEASRPKPHTIVPLPRGDGLVFTAIATTALALDDVESPHSSQALKSELYSIIDTDIQKRRVYSSCSDELLAIRDQICETMLRTGRFVYGQGLTASKRASSSVTLRDRGGEGVPGWMKSLIPTHAHLFPSK